MKYRNEKTNVELTAKDDEMVKILVNNGWVRVKPKPKPKKKAKGKD